MVGIETVAGDSRHLQPALAAAASLNALYVNVQVPDACADEETAAARLADLLAASDVMKCPLLIETHRGCVTQDLLRTHRYLGLFPELRLTIDFSHYVVAGHIDSDPGPAGFLLDELLTRTTAIHLRVSHGHQVQVAIDPNVDSPIMRNFDRWWRTGMRFWLDRAKPGDVLPIVELGPPPYAMTVPGSDPPIELSDRWSQALALRDYALAAWEHVSK